MKRFSRRPNANIEFLDKDLIDICFLRLFTGIVSWISTIKFKIIMMWTSHRNMLLVALAVLCLQPEELVCTKWNVKRSPMSARRRVLAAPKTGLIASCGCCGAPSPDQPSVHVVLLEYLFAWRLQRNVPARRRSQCRPSYTYFTVIWLQR